MCVFAVFSTRCIRIWDFCICQTRVDIQNGRGFQGTLKGESFTPSWILFCTIHRTIISWEKKYIRHFHLMLRCCWTIKRFFFPKHELYLNQFSNKKGAICKPERPKRPPIWAVHPHTHLSTKYPWEDWEGGGGQFRIWFGRACAGRA